jgi:transcriptional regulator with XRE-family HTH domain
VWVPPKEYKTLCSSLAEARKRARLTQQQLARQLHKPQSFVSAYERGHRRIDVLEFLRIVETLGGDPRKVFADVLARRTRRKVQTD